MSDLRWTVEAGNLVWHDSRDWDITRDDLAYQLWTACDTTIEAHDALVAAVNDAARIPQLEAEIARLREGLDRIAEPDTLLDANEEAFNEHAARRMQRQARYLLAPPAPDTGESRTDVEIITMAEYEHRYGQQNDQP